MTHYIHAPHKRNFAERPKRKTLVKLRKRLDMQARHGQRPKRHTIEKPNN